MPGFEKDRRIEKKELPVNGTGSSLVMSKYARSNESIHGVWHQRNVTGTLDRYCECSLMFRTGTRDPAGKDLPSLRHISLQLGCIFVIDIVMLFI